MHVIREMEECKWTGMWRESAAAEGVEEECRQRPVLGRLAEKRR